MAVFIGAGASRLLAALDGVLSPQKIKKYIAMAVDAPEPSPINWLLEFIDLQGKPGV